jgi:RDD family
LLAAAIAMLTLPVYFAFSEGIMGGMTIGKRLLGIAVRNEEPLTPIAFSDAILRELPRLVFPILLFAQAIFGALTPLPSLALLLLIVDHLWPLWDRRRQTLHDKLAHTVVIRVQDGNRSWRDSGDVQAAAPQRRLRRDKPRAAMIGGILALLVGSGPLAAASTPATGRMVLQASDLPPGFIVDRVQTGPYTNRDAIRALGPAAAAKIRRFGRVTGYRAFYRQRDPGRGALPGVIGFGASVALFRSARGAHAALADPIAGCRNKTFTIIGLGGHHPVGPDTLVCTRGTRLGAARVRIFVVQWRNRRTTGSVYVAAFEGAVTPVTALTGARKQNRRMTAALDGG